MEGVRVHRGKIQIDFYDGRRRVRKTLDLQDSPSNLRRAAKLRQSVLAQIDAGVFNEKEFFGATPKRGTTFSEFVKEKWLPIYEQSGITNATFVAAKGWLERTWIPKLGDKQLRVLKPSDVQLAVASIEWKSEGTRRTALKSLRGVLRAAYADGLTDKDLSLGLTGRKKYRPREANPFTIEEAAMLVAKIREKSEMVADFYEFLFETGMRPGEALVLMWSDVDLERGTVEVTKTATLKGQRTGTKTDRDRRVELTPIAVEVLKRRKAATPDKQEVWISDFYNRALADQDGLRAGFWKPALSSLGLPYREPYQTRHSNATWRIMSGANPRWIADQLGHTMTELLRTYAKWISDTDQGSELARFNAFMVTKRSPQHAD